MSTTVGTTTDIRPFETEVAQEDLDDLRRRIAETRWPSRELVTDRSQNDFPTLKTVDHVATTPGIGKSAWFKDPDGNTLAIFQPE
jgi:hypothetical protein